MAWPPVRRPLSVLAARATRFQGDVPAPAKHKQSTSKAPVKRSTLLWPSGELPRPGPARREPLPRRPSSRALPRSRRGASRVAAPVGHRRRGNRAARTARAAAHSGSASTAGGGGALLRLCGREAPRAGGNRSRRGRRRHGTEGGTAKGGVKEAWTRPRRLAGRCRRGLPRLGWGNDARSKSSACLKTFSRLKTSAGNNARL